MPVWLHSTGVAPLKCIQRIEISVGKMEMKTVNATLAIEAFHLTKPENKAYFLEGDVTKW